MKGDEIEYVLAGVDDETKSLFKGFLKILEDVKHEHDEVFHKLAKNFPEMFKTLDICNYLDDNKMKHLRKKVLDLGNEAIRNNRTHVKVNFSKKFNS